MKSYYTQPNQIVTNDEFSPRGVLEAFVELLDSIKQNISFDQSRPEKERVGEVVRIDGILAESEESLYTPTGEEDLEFWKDPSGHIDWLASILDEHSPPFCRFHEQKEE